MNNTFWTLIEDNYYRIYNGILKYAPVGIDNNILLKEEACVEVISANRLNLINNEFGSNFIISDFS